MGTLCVTYSYDKNKNNESFNDYTMPTENFYLPKETIEKDQNQNNEIIKNPRTSPKNTYLKNTKNNENKNSILKKKDKTIEDIINPRKKSVKISVPEKFKKMINTEKNIFFAK